MLNHGGERRKANELNTINPITRYSGISAFPASKMGLQMFIDGILVGSAFLSVAAFEGEGSRRAVNQSEVSHKYGD